MLEYITAKKYKHLKSLYRLWNGEYRSLYPIKKNYFKDIILEDENINLDASFVALYDNEPVGFIFTKTWCSESGLASSEKDVAHISLFYVKKEMRNMGLGSDMLKLVLAELKKYHAIKKLVVGNEMNKIFSGIPSELNEAAIFFVNKGFVQKESVVDMIRVIRNDNIEDLTNSDLKTQIATEDEKDEIIKLCVTNGWGKEAYLVNQYFDRGGTGRRICIGLKDDKVVAFVRFNDRNQVTFNHSSLIKSQNVGSINFVKVDKDYLNCGYEITMNKATKNYLLKRGCKQIIVLATNEVNFYKELGYSAYKYYLTFELAL